jgi:hypothetical protein
VFRAGQLVCFFGTPFPVERTQGARVLVLPGCCARPEAGHAASDSEGRGSMPPASVGVLILRLRDSVAALPQLCFW